MQDIEALSVSANLFKGLPELVPVQVYDFTDAVKRAGKARSELFALHDRLAQLVQWHGKTIATRLLKRPKEKRKALFRKINPDLRPLPLELVTWQQDEKSGSRFRYLNYEDLAAGTNFASLLAARALYSPSEWALFDAWNGLSATNTYVPFVSMVTYGGKDSYGNLLETPELSDTSEDDRRETLRAGTGFQVLEHQTQLLSFLIACTEATLQDLDLTTPPTVEFPLTPADIVSLHPPGGKSLMERYHLRPYSHPPQFSIDAVIQVLLSRVAEAEDDVWLLRTDPVYFHTRLQEIFAHRVIQNQDRKSKANQYGSDPEWDEACGTLVTESYEAAAFWIQALRQAQGIQASLLNPDVATVLEPNGQLEESYWRRLATFEASLQSLQRGRIIGLTRVTANSPGFRHLFIAKDNPRVASVYSLNKEAVRKEAGDDKQKDILQLIMDLQDSILGSVTLWHRHRLLTLIDEILIKDAHQRNRVSPRLLALISDIFATNSLLLQLKMHRPRYPPFDTEEMHDEIRPWFEPIVHLREQWRQCLKLPTAKWTATFQQPYLFADNRPSREEEHATRVALQMVWSVVDNHVFECGGKTLLDLFDDYIPSRTVLPDSAILSTPPEPAPFAIPVKKKVMRCFAFIFPSSSDDGADGDVSWEDFKAGMRQIGFRVDQVFGTEWRFTPTYESSWAEYPLTIREPHPQPRFFWQQARTISLRLRRHYGLLRSCFVISSD